MSVSKRDERAASKMCFQKTTKRAKLTVHLGGLVVAHGGRVDERVDVLAGQAHAVDARVGRRVLHVRGWRVRVGHVGHLAEVLRLGGRAAHPIQPRAGLEGRVAQIRPRAPVRQGRGVLGPSCNETQTVGL